ncbi:MAG: LysR family substrate-binding domain-containing protein, partial [Streptomycetaceae bacterium]|nr:LysR family substrate-binding domain-containing protein [Streptomycetaceae bacterium]
LIAAFRERRPDVPLDLRPIGTAEQVRRLADGSLDVGVLRHPCETRGLVLGPMLVQPVGVLLRSASPAAAAPEIHISDLRDHDLVVFPREQAPGTYDELLAACRRQGYDPPAVHQSPHPEFTLGLVLAGTAIALVPRTDEAHGATWRPLLGRPLAWHTSCAWRSSEHPDPVVAEFADVATEVLRREAAMTPLAAAARPVVPRPASGFLA